MKRFESMVLLLLRHGDSNNALACPAGDVRPTGDGEHDASAFVRSANLGVYMKHHRMIFFAALTAVAAFFASQPSFAATAPAVASFESGGRTIRVDFYVPAPGKNTHHAIIVLYGAGGMLFDGPEMRHMAERLSRDGNSVYLLHYFNRTGSLFFAGDAGMQKNFDTWLRTIRDAVTWVQREQAQRGDGSRAIGIYGYSLGAFLALAGASNNPAVGAIVEQSGGIWNNHEKTIDRLPPALLIHGRADGRVPFDKYAEPLVRLLRKRGSTFETRFYAGEGHSFSPAAQAQVREQTVDFFRRNLR